MDDAASLKMCTLSHFTNFYLHYFRNFSKLEKTHKTNKQMPKPNKEDYLIEKHHLKNYRACSTSCN